MIVKGTSVIGLPIITIKNGEKIKDVDDIIYDPRENKVKALLVSSGSLFSDAKVVLVDQVQSIGKDAVIIESADLLKSASDVDPTVAHIASDETYLTKTKVLTDTGTDLGHVTDIFFEEKTGVVTEFEVSKGLVNDMQSGKKKFKVKDIETIGKDATIVKSSTEDTFTQQANQQGVQGTLQSSKQKAPEVIDQAKEKVNQLTQQIKEKTQEATSKIKEKTQDIKESPQMQQVKDASKKTQEHGDQKAKEIQNKSTQPPPTTPSPYVVVESPGDVTIVARSDTESTPSKTPTSSPKRHTTRTTLSEREKRDKEVKKNA